ncbi:putative SAM-dependent methyltransferase [Lachnospiraceae bacterium JC7]|nr:putative SAM-dependent methyltransferase [Lachnospiraceae bacterium JC7]
MNLPYRLKRIVELVPPSDTIADIGCDHAYVSIELVRSGKAKRALACDINKGPLQSAAQNIAGEGLSQKIETRLSDGLKEVKPHEADTVIIAGMGGLLMERILTGRLRDFDRFVLSPQSDIEHFRHFLIDNGMNIVSEDMLIDEKKYYTIMTAVPADTVKPQRSDAGSDGKNTASSCDNHSASMETSVHYKNEEDFIYGGLLLHHKNETLYSFLKKEKLRYEGILEKTQNEAVRKSYELCLKALEAYK